MATKRQLAAIMFTDIQGYSAMMQADEEYARRIRHRHRSVFKEAHERHGGTILQYYGDGTLSIFESAAAAVECAVDMQIEYRKEPEVPLRIGIHTGDISYDEDGAYGDGLNIAARIERLSIPGSVYISAKVYDDIKNHKWLTAISLGQFRLRNIRHAVEIFSITCKGMEVPTDEEVIAYPESIVHEQYREDPEPMPAIVGGKRKGVAAFLALFLGMFGVHRFYLGQRRWGMWWLILSVLALLISVSGNMDFPPIAIFPIIGFLDFVLLLAMPKVEFNQKYNGAAPGSTTKRKSRRERRKTRREPRHARKAPVRERYERPSPRRTYAESSEIQERSPLLAKGLRYYKAKDYDTAIEAFEKAVEQDPGLTAAYFNLACAYSIKRDAEKAYRNLTHAIEAGFDDFDRIKKHLALAYLRSRPDFEAYVANGYKVVEKLPEPSEDLIENINRFNPEVLDKLELLGDRLESGELTRTQFEEEKRRILGHD